MWPALRSGDEAGFARLECAPTVGAVVIARIGGALLAHRVLGVDASGVRLRGDNSLTDDPRVPESQLLGEVRCVRRGGRELERWDVGPTVAGRARVVVKRAVARVLRRAS